MSKNWPHGISLPTAWHWWNEHICLMLYIYIYIKFIYIDFISSPVDCARSKVSVAEVGLCATDYRCLPPPLWCEAKTFLPLLFKQREICSVDSRQNRWNCCDVRSWGKYVSTKFGFYWGSAGIAYSTPQTRRARTIFQRGVTVESQVLSCNVIKLDIHKRHIQFLTSAPNFRVLDPDLAFLSPCPRYT